MSDSRNDPAWGGYTSEHPEPLSEIVGMPPEENPNQTYRVGSDAPPPPAIRRAMQQQSSSDEPPSAPPSRSSRRRGKLPDDMLPASPTMTEDGDGDGEDDANEGDANDESSEGEDTEQTS